MSGHIVASVTDDLPDEVLRGERARTSSLAVLLGSCDIGGPFSYAVPVATISINRPETNQ